MIQKRTWKKKMMLSIVDAASVMYWNMSHFFVVFFSIWPQVKINKSRVDVTALPISLLHKLPQMEPDSLHTPDGATPDLHLSPLTGAQQFTCETTNHHYNNTVKSICLSCISQNLSRNPHFSAM